MFGRGKTEREKLVAQNRRLLREFPWLWCLKQEWHPVEEDIRVESAEECLYLLTEESEISKISGMVILCDGMYGEASDICQSHRCIVLQKESSKTWAALAAKARPRGCNIAFAAALLEDKSVVIMRPKSDRFYLTHACGDSER